MLFLFFLCLWIVYFTEKRFLAFLCSTILIAGNLLFGAAFNFSYTFLKTTASLL